MESAINTEARISRLEELLDEVLSHVSTKADTAASKADIAELSGILRILIALNIGIALAIFSMIVGWLPAGP